MKLSSFLVFSISTLLVFAGAGPAQTTTPSKTVPAVFPGNAGSDDRYRIGFQDVLDIQVFRHPELSGRATVNPNGTIYLFRLDKPLTAVCKTERELANEIMAAYKVSYLRDPQVNVSVAEQKSQAMMVIGAVGTPGPYYVTRKTHLLGLLAMAGGPNKEAGNRVIVYRAGSTSNCKTADSVSPENESVALLSYKIRDVQEGKKTLWMQPGDVVSVLDADAVYVYGNVTKPGEVRFKEPITLRQAIATSEGVKSATDYKAVRVLRQIPDSVERKEFIFNLSDIDKGKASDPYLEPNDIVAVSKDPLKDILVGIGTALRNGIPSIMQRGVPIP